MTVKNTDLIKQTAGELATAAKAMGVAKWEVERAIELTGSNSRKIVSEFLEKEKDQQLSILGELILEVLKMPGVVGIGQRAQELQKKGYLITKSS